MWSSLRLVGFDMSGVIIGVYACRFDCFLTHFITAVDDAIARPILATFKHTSFDGQPLNGRPT